MKSRFVSDVEDTSPSLEPNFSASSFDPAIDPSGETPHHQESPASVTILPDLPTTTGEDGSANAGKGASAGSFAMLDVQVDAGHPATDTLLTSIDDAVRVPAAPMLSERRFRKQMGD